MKIELLVSAIQNGDNPKAIRKHDVITVQKEGHDWGVGDLAGRFVFVVEETLPCESVEPDRRCAACEYYGIEWERFPPTIGTKGSPKRTCPIQKYGSENAEFEYDIDIHGIPYFKRLYMGRACSVDYTLLLSQPSITECENEKASPKGGIPLGTKKAKLARARNPSNAILDVNITKKEKPLISSEVKK